MPIPKGAGRPLAVGVYFVRIYWARVALATLIFGAGLALGERRGRSALTPAAPVISSCPAERPGWIYDATFCPPSQEAEPALDEAPPASTLVCKTPPAEAHEPEASRATPLPEPSAELPIPAKEEPLPALADDLAARWSAFLGRMDAAAAAVDGAGERLGVGVSKCRVKPPRAAPKRRWH